MLDRQDAVEAARESVRAASDGLMAFGRAVGEVFSVSKRFMKETARASYNSVGKYTFPIEQELLGSQPPQLSELNPYGRAALFAMGVIPVSWILSLTAIPFVGNSIQSLPRGFIDIANLTLAPDDELKKTNIPGVSKEEDDRSLLRKGYGAPGYLLGATAGVSVATLVLGGRIGINSGLSAGRAFAYLTNGALDTEDLIPVGDDQRSTPSQILGSPGLILGGVAGLLGFATVGLGRIVTNSFWSSGRAFAFMTNGALAKENEMTVAADPRNTTRQVLGVPGLLLGGVAGLFGFAAVGLGRIVVNSLWSAGRAVAFMTNGALEKEDEIKIEEDKRSTVSRVLGVPGLLIGGVAGLVGFAAAGLGRILTNSFESTGRAFAFMTNGALDKEDEMTVPADQRNTTRKVLGVPGLLLGGIAGLVGFAAVGLGRIVTNSFWSTGRAFAFMTNGALEKEDEIKVEEDQRNTTRKVLGVPGLLIGGVAGLVGFAAVGLGRIVTNSATSISRAFRFMTNGALDKEDEFTLEADQRSTTSKVLGVPGLLIGGVAGLVGFAAAGLGRMVTNSFWSAGRAFAFMTNGALEKENEIKVEADQRNTTRKVLGVPGLLIGGVAGLLGFAVAGLGRVTTNTGTSISRAFRFMTNGALDKEDEFTLEEDQRSTTNKVLGVPGLLIGGIAGLVGFAAVGLGRIVTNSFWSTGRTFAFMTNGALEKEDEIKIEADQRNTTRKMLGVPGLFIGGVVGLVGFAAVGLGRVVANSGWSTGRVFAFMTNGALEKEDEIKVEEDQRNITRKVLGVPGLLIGGVAGLVGFAGVGLGRIVINSATSISRAFRFITNGALDQEDEFTLAADQRSIASKVLGVPGLLIGGMAGLVGFAAAGLGRIVTNSFWSTGRAFAFMTNGALEKEDAIKVEADQRNTTRKVLGVPGLLIGGVAGLFGFAAAGLGRIVTNSFWSAGRAFARTTNAALAKNDEIPLAADTRNTKRKVLGVPGLILGGVAGLFGFAAVCAGRFLNQTRKSFQALSGSFMNGGFGRPLCDGLGGDNRSGAKKAVGGLGYVAAVATAFPVSVGIWLARKAPLTIFAGVGGLLFSPLIALAKWCKKPRFAEARQQGNGQEYQRLPGAANAEQKFSDQADIEQGFKNIFSSLTWQGRLKPGTQVKTNASGKESGMTFFRKSITFNADSITEKTLNALLKHYREFESHDEGGIGAGFFNGQAFANAVQEVKDRLLENDSCIPLPAAEIASIFKQVDNVANFVKNYMLHRLNQPEQIRGDLYPALPSYFWGGDRGEGQAAMAPSAPSPRLFSINNSDARRANSASPLNASLLSSNDRSEADEPGAREAGRFQFA